MITVILTLSFLSRQKILVLKCSRFQEIAGAKVSIMVNYWLLKIKRQCLPGFVRLAHIKLVNIEVKVVEATNLIDETIANDYQSWMYLADGNIRELPPRIRVDIELSLIHI